MVNIIVILLGVLLMGTPYLTIGTATDRIDLLDDRGFHVLSWEPQAADHAATFNDSAMADGRQLVAVKDVNIVDTFELQLRQRGPDAAIQALRNLRKMLVGAVNYWASRRADLGPVYLEAKAACETNIRYAVVHDARLPADSNYYGQPFLQEDGGSVSEVTLLVEHGPWLENLPGTGTCVEASGKQLWNYTQITDTSSPIASGDDACASHHFGEVAMNLTGTTLPLGYDTETKTDVGVRFVDVAVPQGATITAAYVTFDAALDSPNKECMVDITGQDADDAATFSTLGDFNARPRTTAIVHWDNIEGWVVAKLYDTPSLVTIIQEIINRPGWVSGNDLALFFTDNGSDQTPAVRYAASWDHATRAAPLLTIVYATPSDSGRDDTCLNEVYAANKHNVAQLSHSYHYDASLAAWSGNKMGAVLPVALLPAAIENNDIVYFGIRASLTDSGPFCSLVFDIGTPAVYAGATAALAWEYYNSAAGWQPLNVTDNTDGGDGPFSVAGVHSVHWEQPSTWGTVAVNGITAYWVRVIATIGVGDSISTPTQQNRDIYTVVWPFVDIAADQVGGDIPALARIKIHNVSDGLDVRSYANRVLVGLRSVSRGANYTPYINLSDEQNPAGIYPILYTNMSFTNDVTVPEVQAPTGRRMRYDPTGVEALTERAAMILSQEIFPEYYGTFHVFLRARQAGGAAGDIGVRLRFESGWGGASKTTETKYFSTTNAWQLLDFGRVDLPSTDTKADEGFDRLAIWIATSAASGTPYAYFYDLILFPTDEWAGSFKDPGTIGYLGSRYGIGHRYLDIDSIGRPKNPLRAILRYEDDIQITAWEPGMNSSFAILQPNEQQRLWFLTLRTASAGSSDWRCEPYVCHSIQVFRTNRYLAARGTG